MVDIAQLVTRPGSVNYEPSFLANATELVLPDLGIPIDTEEDLEEVNQLDATCVFRLLTPHILNAVHTIN